MKKYLGQFFLALLVSLTTSIVFADPGTPVINWMTMKHETGAPINVSWKMWGGEKGTAWTLQANHVEVCSKVLSDSPDVATQEGSCDISLDEGEYDLQVILFNESSSTSSEVKKIIVEGSEKPQPKPTLLAPGKPNIAWISEKLDPGQHLISWNMWYGVNGSSWALESNGTEICQGSLTENSNKSAQSGQCNVYFKTGKYELQVLLKNTAGTTVSDTKTVTVGDDPNNDGTANPLPTNYNSPDLRKNKPYKNDSGSVVGSYFVEWGIFGRDYHANQIPASNLTHLLYAFLPICGPNDSLKNAMPSSYESLLRACKNKKDYEVTIHDPWAALEKAYPGDNWNQSLKGNFNQLRRIKAAYPELTILPSVGGWTLSDPFHDFDDEGKRKIFINSVIDFLKTYTFFDGVDIDWEFPGGGGANGELGKEVDGNTYVVLMKELRSALDVLGSETGRKYQLTSAVGAAPSKINQVDYKQIMNDIDLIFAMTYDFYGAWDNTIGDHTGIYASHNSVHEGYNLDDAVKNLLQAGVPKNKLVIGAAMYGRGWQNVTEVVDGNPYTGKGHGALKIDPENGHWEPGVVDYYRIVDEMLGGNPDGKGVNGWIKYRDEKALTPYLWNPNTTQFITYEDQKSAKAKGKYARNHELAGVFSWALDADSGDILNGLHEGLGHSPER